MTNKELLIEFYDKVFNAWDVTDLNKYMREDYIQHNPTVMNGRDGFIEFTQRFFTQKPHMEIQKIICEDDIVVVFFKVTMLINGSENKVCDIYRVQDGKLAEHWDVVQHIPADQVPINDNGHF